MLLLGKFKNVVKIDALKCANTALMRYNSSGSPRANRTTVGLGKLKTNTGKTTVSVGKILSDDGKVAVNKGKSTAIVDTVLTEKKKPVSGGKQGRSRNVTGKSKSDNPRKLGRMTANELFEALGSASVIKSGESRKVGKSTSRRKSGMKMPGLKFGALPFGDKSGLLSDIVLLNPSHAFAQQMTYANQAIPPNNNQFYDAKRFESIHTERANVEFECPVIRKERKKKLEKFEYSKVDCASLLEKGVIQPPDSKEKRFGCKNKSVKSKYTTPNACGVIFECPKKVAEKQKQTHCAVILTTRDFLRYLQGVCGNVLEKLNLKPEKGFMFRDIAGDTLAMSLAYFNTTSRTDSPYTVEDWPLFEKSAQQGKPSKAKNQVKQSPRKHVIKSAFRKRIVSNSINYSPQRSDETLRISDAELLRLSLKDSSKGSANGQPLNSLANRNIATRNINDEQSKNKVDPNEDEGLSDDRFIAAPTSVLTPMIPPSNSVEIDPISEFKSPKKVSLEDMQVLTIEGGNVEINDSKNRRSEGTSNSGEAREFKPLPGQICCPKGDEGPLPKGDQNALPKEAEKPKPVCCPSKNSAQNAATDKPKTANGTEKAAVLTRPNTKPDPKDPEACIRKSCDTAKRKSIALKEDPNVFNCCASIVGPRKVEINNCPMPKLKDDSVIVKMHTVGLCSSDVYLFEHGSGKENGPIVLGHEGTGVVYKAGKNVKTLRPGDIVALEPGIPCLCCSYCRSGLYNLCPSMEFNGMLQTYCGHPASFCCKIPKGLDPTLAALTHPVALGLQACRKGCVSVGSTVLVLGACPLGLSAVMAARAMGADKIIVIDTLEKNLRVAYELCADKTILATCDLEGDQLAEKVLMEAKGQPNVVIDCCGCTKTINLGTLALKPGGKFVLAGCQSDCANIPILAVLAKDLHVHASFRTCNEFGNALNMIETKRADVAKLITHRTEFCEAQEGFDWAVDEEKSEAIKVVIYWPHTTRKL